MLYYQQAEDHTGRVVLVAELSGRLGGLLDSIRDDIAVRLGDTVLRKLAGDDLLDLVLEA